MNISDLITSGTGTNSSSATDSNTSNTSNSTDSSSATAEQFTTFLSLLTAQIKNQDPLAPLESTQFVEQLATFSGLELQATANNFLEDISAMLALQTIEDANLLPETNPDEKTT